MWYSNATNQDCKALQRVVRLAERISGSALPSLQDIDLKRCKSSAAKINQGHKSPWQPSLHFTAIWQALPEHDGKNWETEELLPSGHQAPKLELGLITLTRLNLINYKIFTILHHTYCSYVYIPGTTCLHIPLSHPCLYYYLLSTQYTALHILFYCTFYSLFFLFIYTYIYIYSLVLRILHCPLSGPDLVYISLQIIFCIIEYVTNKKKLEPREPAKWSC